MALGDTTSATTTTTIILTSDRNCDSIEDFPMQEQDLHKDIDELEHEADSVTDVEYEDSYCLFCNEKQADMDQNLIHMSKSHGLHVERKNLLVDVGSLLAYFHLVISCYHECLYCGKQRSNMKAIQQHMLAKGHCMYDIANEDSEYREFYLDDDTLNTQQRAHRISSALPQKRRHALRRKSQPRRQSNEDRNAASAQESTNLINDPRTNQSMDSDIPGEPSEGLRQLSARALKQEFSHKNALSRLSADDRRSLVHLPLSQQRSILATHQSQLANARRTKQVHRSSLETAGNHFNRLSTVRLVRKPPHYGNVSSLNR